MLNDFPDSFSGAEAHGFDLQRLIPGVVTSRAFDDALDIAAVVGRG
jgi:hypothetical protein